ncbi:tetratricopeptide repeat (TPR)-like superfamily protein [Actinidia rufa]|uniref:Tetratricopeptide repeat (TPR)-like superfamily protein n=1 Tax=Actinidia rufa TaxID=165716 RepID=A0A7J0ENE8_9ERIC|nr:tetratricopeptide repeat (TPR)-like superfamily protein [Actinidia rufa]
MATDGFTPDKATTDIAIRTLCNNGRVDHVVELGSEVLWVYKKMKEESAESDLVTYNTLVFGLSKSGRVKEAKKFLGVMAEMSHLPDDVTYTSLMNGMCREGNALGALQLLEEMEAKGVVRIRAHIILYVTGMVGLPRLMKYLTCSGEEEFEGFCCLLDIGNYSEGLKKTKEQGLAV